MNLSSPLTGTSIIPQSTPAAPSPPQNPLRKLPSTVRNPNDALPTLQRAVIHQVSPSDNNPTIASVLIENRLPARPGFTLPSGIGQFYQAGSTVSYRTVSSSTIAAGSHTLVPTSMGFANSTLQVGDSVVVDSGSNQEVVTVTAINTSGGVPVSFNATFTKPHDGTYAYPVVMTLAAPGPFYDNPTTNVGGSYCLVDTESMTVVQLLQGVSTSFQSSSANLISTHVHTGLVDSNGNPMPQPIDLQNHTQGTIGTGQLPNGLPPAPTIERLYVPGDSDPHATTISATSVLNGAIQDFLVSTWVSNVPQDHSCNKIGWAIRKSIDSSGPSIVKQFRCGLSDGAGTFTAYNESGVVSYSAGLAFDSTGTYVPLTGNLVCFLLSEPVILPAGWNTITGAFANLFWYKKWDNATDTVNTLLYHSHKGYAAWEIQGQDPTNPITQHSDGTGSNQSYSAGPITPSQANTLGLALATTVGFGGFYDPTLSGESFNGGFVADGFSAITYSGPGGPDSGTVIVGHADLPTTSPVSCTLSLPSEWIGQTLTMGIVFINPHGAGSPGPWSFFQETYIPNLPNPGAEQELTGAYGQVINGTAYDLGICYVQTGEVKGPISIFASNFQPGALLGLQSGLNLIPDPAWKTSVYNTNPHFGFPSATSNLFWYFNLLDNFHNGVLSPSTEAEENAFFAGIGLGAATLGNIWALSSGINVVAGQDYTLSSLVNSVRLTGTGLDGKGMYLAIVSYADPNSDGSVNFPSAIYAYATVPNGSAGGTSVQVPPWTCPSDGSVTKVRILLNFNGIHQNSGVENAFFSKPMFQTGTSATGFNYGSQVASDGSVRSIQSVTQKLILSQDGTAQSSTTSPTVTPGTVTPVSGGSAPDYDKQPQYSLRVAPDATGTPSIFQQTSSDKTHPQWLNRTCDCKGTVSNFTFHYQFVQAACLLMTEDGSLITDESGNNITTEVQDFLYWWIDGGTDGTSIIFYFKDGSTATIPSNGTSTSPNVWGVANDGDTVFVSAYGIMTSGVWSIVVNLQNSQPTASQLIPVYSELNVALIGSYVAQVGVMGSTDTGTILGGAGSPYVT